mmetsp:Transcript_20434/g.47516  ORF Transcript_20434/g.47516 Transcript_20434/m.47516 type:complete len:202 (+) Transcript_20434:299-904(+)
MEGQHRQLQPPARRQDRLADLSHGRGHQKNRGEDAEKRGHREHFLNGFGRVLVQRHAEQDRDKDHLNRRDGDAHRVHWHDRAEEPLAQEGGHEDGADGGRGRHDDREGDIALGDVSAEVGGLATVDRTYEDHARRELRAQTSHLAEGEGKDRHHHIATRPLGDDRRQILGENVREVLRRQGDAHAEHEEGEASREVLSGQP